MPLTWVILPVKSHDSAVWTAYVVETNRPIVKTSAQQTRVRGSKRQTADWRFRPGQQISSTQLLTRVPQSDVAGFTPTHCQGQISLAPSGFHSRSRVLVVVQVQVGHGTGDGHVSLDVLSGHVFDAVPGRDEPQLLNHFTAVVDQPIVVTILAATLII